MPCPSSHPSEQMGTLGNKEWDLLGFLSSSLVSASLSSLSLSLTLSWLSPHWLSVDASSPRIIVFFLCLLSTYPSPNSSLKNPREALRLVPLGHILDNLHGSESKRLRPAQLWVVCPPVGMSQVRMLWLAAPITVTWVTLQESAPQQNWVLFPKETQSG